MTDDTKQILVQSIGIVTVLLAIIAALYFGKVSGDLVDMEAMKNGYHQGEYGRWVKDALPVEAK